MPTEPKPSNPDVQYEETDAHVRPLYQFLFWISAITILTAILAGGILRALESWRERASERAVMAEPQEQQLPPAPRLQNREPLDLAAFRKEEAEILSTYGVVDREKGVYRIPIEEAMRLTVERGLPSVGEPAGSGTVATEPSKAARK
jgi:hypothetical protein